MIGRDVLSVPCPTCAALPRRRCRIPSGRHERAPHGARWRAFHAQDEQVSATIAAYDAAHILRRVLAQQGEDEEAAA